MKHAAVLCSFTVASLTVATSTARLTTQETPAAAIVSRNESIRDQVIQRECGDSIDRAGYGPRVNAGANETLNELEASTETHLEALAKIVAIRPRGSGLVLVTGGTRWGRTVLVNAVAGLP